MPIVIRYQELSRCKRLTCRFQLWFYKVGVAGVAGSSSPRNGFSTVLPNTATHVFNVLVPGVLLFLIGAAMARTSAISSSFGRNSERQQNRAVCFL